MGSPFSEGIPETSSNLNTTIWDSMNAIVNVDVSTMAEGEKALSAELARLRDTNLPFSVPFAR